VRHARATAVLAALLAGGCAVGPDFARPPAPGEAAYTPAPQPEVMAPANGDAVQRLNLAHELSSAWWELYRSPALDEVVKRTLADNRDLALARASLAQAQQFVKAARGAYYPQIDASGVVQQQANLDTSPAGLESEHGSTLYSVGATASYLLDVFGGVRRSVEQQSALAELQRYELAAAWIALTGNAVTQSVAIASLRAQIEAVEDVVGDDSRSLELVLRKFDAGKVARSDVLTARTQLASDQAQLPALRRQLAAAQHALSVLAGQPPAAWSPPEFSFDDFTLPEELPLTLPSELVRRRPDILAAEADLHASSAAIGVATANMFPSFSLSGTLSVAESAAVINGPGAAYSLAAQVLQPVFRGGSLRAQRNAAIAAYDASLASYQQTVLTAFQQVADTLRALEHDAELVDAQQRLLSTAEEALALQRVRYDAGKIDLLELLDAQRSYGQARLSFALAHEQRLADTAALYVALGGGWWDAGI
jgi:NodT family efflux transporter outer membrane factor (OMF) lipoprotein